MKYIKSIYIGLVGLLMTACQTEQWEASQGSLCITLAEDVSISTKSTPAELGKPTAERFTLNIVKESTGENTYNGIYKQTIPASTGAYTVTATYGTNLAIALDSPYYKGEETGVEVEVNQSTPVTLTCKVANALASVIYGEGQIDKFDELFSTYGVEVKVGNSSVTIGRNDSTTQSAYYRAGSTPTFTFKGTLKESNKNVSMEITSDKLTADAFQAGQHCKLTLSLAPATAGAIITVEKVEVETVTISETIPVEWLPKPKIEAEGFEANKLTFTETETPEASIKLNTSSTLQDLKIKFNFEDPQFTMFNQEYTLSTLDEETRKNIEETLGIFLPQVGDAASTIQLNNLIAQLQTKNAGETTNNTIELDVKANNRWSSEDATTNRVYTLTCNKPEFSVSVDAENCWSREFTINEITVTTGNAEKIKNNLRYEYYNGTEWVECATREDIKGRTQQFNSSAENIAPKNYRVRALYRGTIASTEAEAILETPEQLPNSQMEEWHYTGPFSHDVYSYYPYVESNESFWSTNNDYTTRYRQGTFGYPYNCFPAVSYVPGRNGGKAAEIRNTASGAGNTIDSFFGDAKIDNRNKVAGMLFIGDFECSTGVSATNYSYTKTNGKEFNVRPTSLKFWYKYIPYTNDTWQAHIELWDENKEIIIQQNFQSSIQKNDFEEVEIKLNYDDQQTYPICKYIYIIFQSTITEGGNMPFEWFKNTYVLWRDDQQFSYEEPHVGSVLTIDDISLIYDK